MSANTETQTNVEQTETITSLDEHPVDETVTLIFKLPNGETVKYPIDFNPRTKHSMLLHGLTNLKSNKPQEVKETKIDENQTIEERESQVIEKERKEAANTTCAIQSALELGAPDMKDLTFTIEKDWVLRDVRDRDADGKIIIAEGTEEQKVELCVKACTPIPAVKDAAGKIIKAAFVPHFATAEEARRVLTAEHVFLSALTTENATVWVKEALELIFKGFGLDYNELNPTPIVDDHLNANLDPNDEKTESKYEHSNDFRCLFCGNIALADRIMRMDTRSVMCALNICEVFGLNPVRNVLSDYFTCYSEKTDDLDVDMLTNKPNTAIILDSDKDGPNPKLKTLSCKKKIGTVNPALCLDHLRVPEDTDNVRGINYFPLDVQEYWRKAELELGLRHPDGRLNTDPIVIPEPDEKEEDTQDNDHEDGQEDDQEDDEPEEDDQTNDAEPEEDNQTSEVDA